MTLLTPSALDGSDLPKEPTRAPLDLAPLAAFDPRLASQAMALLYLSGDREQALRWIDRLDPTVDTPMPPSTRLKHGWSFSASLADLALLSGDLEALGALSAQPETRERLFTATPLLALRVCVSAMDAGAADLADFLLAQLSPEGPAPEKSRDYHAGDKWDDLAQAAARALNPRWLARCAELKERAGCGALNGLKLAEERFVPPPAGRAKAWSEECVEVLIQRGAFKAKDFVWLAQAEAGRSPPNWEASRARLGEGVARMRAAVKPGDSIGQRHFQRELNELVFMDSRNKLATPLEWARAAVELGARPFLAELNGSPIEPPLMALIATEALHRSTPETDSQAAALVRLLIQMDPEGVDYHHPRSSNLAGSARKMDLTGLAAERGWWETAKALAEGGADWKFSAKQVSAHWRPGDQKNKAVAFFEGLALMSVSEKSSVRRDKRLEKKGEAPAAAPTGPRRI